MNSATEIRRICTRLEELATYCEAKHARAKLRDKTGRCFALDVQERIVKEQNRIKKLHEAESKEMLEDQQQHLAQPEVADAGRESAKADES